MKAHVVVGRGRSPYVLAVGDALRKSLCREAREHDGVQRANASTCQHGDWELCNHGEVHRDGIPLAYPLRLQPVGLHSNNYTVAELPTFRAS